MIKKRVCSTLIFLLSITTLMFAQAIEEESAVEEKVAAAPKVLPVRIGGYGQFQPIAGELAKFFKCNAGGGLALEVGLPAIKNYELGFAAGSSFNVNPIKVDTLKSAVNSQNYLGVYFTVPFGESGFVFHPELDYGLVVYLPKAADDVVENTLKPYYLDQIIVANLGLRYLNPGIAKGRLEFELSPSLTLVPEKETVGVYVGGRLGMFYRVNGPDGKFSEEALAKKAAKADAKAEKKAADAELKAEKKAAAAELKAAKEAEKAAELEAKQKAREEAAAAKAVKSEDIIEE